MQSYRIGTVNEFKEGTKRVFNLGENEVGVFRLGEEFYAWHNICPPQGGPVCQGRLYPRVHENLDENCYCTILHLVFLVLELLANTKKCMASSLKA